MTHQITPNLADREQPVTDAILQEVNDERRRQIVDLGYEPEYDARRPVVGLTGLVRQYAGMADRHVVLDGDLSRSRESLVETAALCVAAIARIDREVAR